MNSETQIRPGDSSKNWMTILGFVLGILPIPCYVICRLLWQFSDVALFTFVGIIGVLALAGVIFSISGMKSPKKRLAYVGFAIAMISFLMMISVIRNALKII